MLIEIAAQTDIGRRKKKNEDSYGVFREDSSDLTFFREGALLCVADGLGGHVAGHIASKLAVSFMKDLLRQPPPPTDELGNCDPLPAIKAAIQRANENIYNDNKAQNLIESKKPMGTTLLSAVVTPRKVFIGNVGDTRCYHIRYGEIIEKTEDHSWVDEQVKAGLMSKAEAESDQRRNVVTRSVGTHPEVEIDTYTWHVVPGDSLLLCSDGLVNMVKDSEINKLFRRRRSSAEIAQRLVNMANENGGLDNITVIVAYISPSLGRRLSLWWTTFFMHHGKKVLWTLITLILCGLSFAAGRFAALHGF
ncbi:MAG: Stp1/IreP family PP2C-type Ser/Thr phosphatase [FCB group bacterium]|jgi:protein phosphatase|nr:Stp1/IreP family PP2C-type Ser/Thr phosphatase [FCB group bacterium]